MSDFINTIDELGDDVVSDSIIQRTITEFKDDKITKLGSYAFYGCTALETVDLPLVSTIVNWAFAGCSALKTVNCPNVTTFMGGYTFRYCSSLQAINLPLLSAFITGYEFQGCSSLKYADFGNLSQIRLSFQGCTSLIALILRKGTVTTLNSSAAFTNTTIESGTGHIYVPRALIEDYKAATNWSTHANQFRALEDYTVDGTTTGELDETKI